MLEREFKKACLACDMGMVERKTDCITFQGYLIPEEEAALSMLRKLKEESHKIQDKISTLKENVKLIYQSQSQGDSHKAQEGLQAELSVCFQQLENLRMAWKEWEARREEANRRKMVLLGHGP